MNHEITKASSHRWFATLISIGVSVIVLFQIWFLGLQMPQEVPIHFDIDGNPDRFSSRAANIWLMTGLVIGTMVFVQGLNWLIPRVPDSLLNLPNKGYWLAPERREATMLRTQTMLLWVGVLTTLLYSALALLNWRVAMEYSTSISPWIWIATFVYMGSILAFCTLSFRKSATNSL